MIRCRYGVHYMLALVQANTLVAPSIPLPAGTPGSPIKGVKRQHGGGGGGAAAKHPKVVPSMTTLLQERSLLLTCDTRMAVLVAYNRPVLPVHGADVSA